MPACARVNTFHSKEQREFSNQAQKMLFRTPEYQKFRALEEQTEDLRLSWLLGAMFFVILIYADGIVWLTGEAEKAGIQESDAFIGSFLRMLPYIFQSTLGALFLLYPVGWMLLAPWYGISGPVEYTQVGRVLLSHLIAAVLFSAFYSQSVSLDASKIFDIYSLSLDQDVIQAQLNNLPKSVKEAVSLNFDPNKVLPVFIASLTPIFSGFFIRWYTASGSWKSRKLLTAPHIWLPPVYGIVNMIVAFSLFLTVTEARGESSAGTELQTFTQQLEKVVNVIPSLSITGWHSEVTAGLFLKLITITTQFILVLLSTQIQLLLFHPMIGSLLIPSRGLLKGIYIAACSIGAYHYYAPNEQGQLPLYWFLMVGYGLFLALRDPIGSGGNRMDYYEEPEDEE